MLRDGDGHFRNWHALIGMVLLNCNPLKSGASGEKKGDLPRDKAPLMTLQNEQSSLVVTFFVAFNTTCGVD